MSTEYALLSLLESGGGHGYELKRAYDERYGEDGALSFGSVYRLLSRLVEQGQVVIVGTEAGSGPDRKRYALTDSGVAELDRWLAEPEEPRTAAHDVLVMKVVLALASHRDASGFLRRQRLRHMARMRELTSRRRSAAADTVLRLDYELFHLEADLRWIELAQQREDAR